MFSTSLNHYFNKALSNIIINGTEGKMLEAIFKVHVVTTEIILGSSIFVPPYFNNESMVSLDTVNRFIVNRFISISDIDSEYKNLVL